MAQILLERFTDVRGPVNDNSCVRKPREPWTLDEVVHLEVGFWISKDKPAMATKEGVQVHCNHPLNRKNLLKKSHSVGTIRGQHYHLVWKDETNSMDSQSAKVMDDTSRFLSLKLLPLLRLSGPDSRLSTRLTSGDDIIRKKLINLIPFADFANFLLP